MNTQKLSILLLKYVRKDDVVGARRLMVGVDDRDKKSIVAKSEDRNAPLFVAVKRGNVDMVEFLVNECHADMEELGIYEGRVEKLFDEENDDLYEEDESDEEHESHSVTPLWCAAALEKLEVVKLLIKLGGDINAVSDTGDTPVLHACGENETVFECLVMHGADVQKRNNDGVTCLMNAVKWSKKLCQILMDKGADVNAQDSSGNTALHFALNRVCWDTRHIVQLLIDHGLDPSIKNKDGEDAFLKASIEGQESILHKLFRKFKPPVERRIELYELLGAYHGNRDPIHVRRALQFWKTAIEMRKTNSCAKVNALQPNPVYIFAQEVKTVEELETFNQDYDLVYMHALMITERILGPGHIRLQSACNYRGEMYIHGGEFRRCINLSKYAFQLRIDRVEKLTSRYIISSLYQMCLCFCVVFRKYRQSNGNNSLYFQIEFQEVLEILQMASTKVDDATEIAISQEFRNDEFVPLSFMKLILQLIKLLTELNKNADQLFSFEAIVNRLVRRNPRTRQGETLLHLSLKESTSKIEGEFFSFFPSVAVAEVLLKCGAAVNDVDNKHNTALHLCSEALRNLNMKHHDLIKRIVALLLKYSPHVDMVNISGETAVDSRISSMMKMHIHDFVSLKCYAASVAMKYSIPYAGQIPAELESFVQMHGICPSKGRSVRLDIALMGRSVRPDIVSVLGSF